MYINSKHRIFGLDIIRALAILLVLCSHSTLLLFPNQNNVYLTVTQFFGTVGVDLFFVLSGYLIGGILLKQINEGKVTVKDFLYFWVRRWFRTLPNYFLILILNILLFYFLHEKIIENIFYFFAFLQNFSSPHPGFFTEAWSLSIEEYAYIVGPLALLILMTFFKNCSKKTLYIVMSLVIIIIITFLRINYHTNHDIISHHDWSKHIRKVVIYRIDSIYYGFLAAFLAQVFHSAWNNYKKWFLVLGILLFIGLHSCVFLFNMQPENSQLFFNVFYLPLLSISLLLFFPFFSSWKTGGPFKNTITKISVLSYALYLINYSIVLLTIQNFISVEGTPLVIKFLILLLYWFLSFGLSYLLFKYFERPMTNLRDSSFFK
ncbi:acyltransferase family protein [Flavivirga spongiicola]|uniref:Acyltransferase n=1 Tax=Flavivirga spongiicola TaxID=421621 RepID=A0ABU7XQN4_9FLAO|nr:acyltransferase [Flavivirga sp. MEBiC05379]MDO5981801.1 acyltransferase [Flavivirga sp. MEBiC05379]